MFRLRLPESLPYDVVDEMIDNQIGGIVSEKYRHEGEELVSTKAWPSEEWRYEYTYTVVRQLMIAEKDDNATYKQWEEDEEGCIDTTGYLLFGWQWTAKADEEEPEYV